MYYDIIGDIHGEAERLYALLARLGYVQTQGVWRHHDRQAVFVGDFIDRGAQQLAVLETVRTMVKACSALAVMGNHEYNAVGWLTAKPDTPGSYLRAHDDKNRRQHQAFLDAVGEFSGLHEYWVAWFKTLPLWLGLDGICVAHACWDEVAMARLAPLLDLHQRVRKWAWPLLFTKGTAIFEAAELVLKGQEEQLPPGVTFYDKDHVLRQKTRVKWWLQGDASWRELVIGDDVARQLPATPSGIARKGYMGSMPVFIGHYWLTGTPACLAPNVACVDYSAASPQGKLVAYRWQGEQQLDDTHFVSVS